MKDLVERAKCRQTEAGGVPGRRLLDLQHGHVRRHGVRRDHQPAAGRDPGGRARAQQRPVVKNGALAIATMMTCTLSVDHRVVDGALGARVARRVQGDRRGPVESDAVRRASVPYALITVGLQELSLIAASGDGAWNAVD